MADCMACIRRNDFEVFIKEWIAADRPFLGICMGLQVLFERSEEAAVPGLGIFPGVVTRFPSTPACAFRTWVGMKPFLRPRAP
ncbi:imidazole glycerol phosphate synthase subunit HisH [Verrucomicrobiota bacterium]|nr:imidazole glycerol phosphate synthase subunit HisH [Verrucomicrobiota bacterium]